MKVVRRQDRFHTRSFRDTNQDTDNRVVIGIIDVVGQPFNDLEKVLDEVVLN